MSAERQVPSETDGQKPLIVMDDEDVVIEYHLEDWLAFAVFWILGIHCVRCNSSPVTC